MAYQDRAPTVGGSLATMASGPEATQAPSDEFLTELGLRALRQAWDTMSERSRTVSGTRPAPTTEQTQALAGMRGARRGPSPNLGGGASGLIGGAARKAAEHSLNRRSQGYMSQRVGRGGRGTVSPRPTTPRPMQQMQQQGTRQTAVGYNPTDGMQPFNPYAAYGGLMG